MQLQAIVFFLFFIISILFTYFYISHKLKLLLGIQHKFKIYLFMGVIELVLMSGFFGIQLLKKQTSIPHFMIPVSWISYTVLSLISFITSIFLIADILFFIGNKFYKNEQIQNIQRRKFLTAGLFLFAAGLSGRAFYNAVQFPKVKNVNIPIANLPAELKSLRIALISDLHIGLTIGKDYLEFIVNEINQANVNIVAITGDLADGFVHQIQHLLQPLSQLKSTHGVYYVTGNHEYYWNAKEWVAFVRSMGIHTLENEHKIISFAGKKLIIAGVTDLSSKYYPDKTNSDPKKSLEGFPTDTAFKLLLAHQPRSAFQTQGLGFDLQLSGHTHGGQFWPWTWVVPFVQPFVAGMSEYKGMKIYVSPGTGYWGPPARLGTTSEISIIELS